MEITVKKALPKLFVTISGDILAGDLGKLDDVIHEIILMKEVSRVIFDLKNVNSITSTILGKFLNLYKKLDHDEREMEFLGVSEKLYEQLVDIHVDRIFPVAR